MKTQMQRELESTYRACFEAFGASALWSKKRLPRPSTDAARVIVRTLKQEGGHDAYRLAERLEALCDAIDRASKKGPASHRRASGS